MGIFEKEKKASTLFLSSKETQKAVEYFNKIVETSSYEKCERKEVSTAYAKSREVS